MGRLSNTFDDCLMGSVLLADDHVMVGAWD